MEKPTHTITHPGAGGPTLESSQKSHHQWECGQLLLLTAVLRSTAVDPLLGLHTLQSGERLKGDAETNETRKYIISTMSGREVAATPVEGQRWRSLRKGQV